MTDISTPYWRRPPAELLPELHSSDRGLSEAEAAARLQSHGPNRLQPRQRHDAPPLFLAQIKSPIIIILLFAAVLSLFLDSSTEAITGETFPVEKNSQTPLRSLKNFVMFLKVSAPGSWSKILRVPVKIF